MIPRGVRKSPTVLLMSGRVLKSGKCHMPGAWMCALLEAGAALGGAKPRHSPGVRTGAGKSQTMSTLLHCPFLRTQNMDNIFQEVHTNIFSLLPFPFIPHLQL